MAEQVDRDHAISALGHLRRQPVVHAPVHEQAVNQDQGSVALAVDVVSDPVAAVVEEPSRVSHQGGEVYLRLAGAGAGAGAGAKGARSHGRATLSAPSTARVAGALFSV